MHVRPRKRLYTPVGGDCPFEIKEVTSKRETTWKCRGKTSVFGDDWQEMSPNRRISSKSWVGCTYFFPVECPVNVKARIMAMTLTVDREPPRGLDAVSSILGLNPVPDSVQKEPAVKPPRERKLRSGRKSAMFEFCCGPDSKLGQINLSRGVDHIRLSKDQTDLENPKDMHCLLSLGSIPRGRYVGQYSVWTLVSLAADECL